MNLEQESVKPALIDVVRGNNTWCRKNNFLHLETYHELRVKFKLTLRNDLQSTVAWTGSRTTLCTNCLRATVRTMRTPISQCSQCASEEITVRRNNALVNVLLSFCGTWGSAPKSE